MTERKIRLVVSDIDATLTYGFSGISEANRQAIIDLQNSGILFGVASGRGYADLKNNETLWDLPKPFDSSSRFGSLISGRSWKRSTVWVWIVISMSTGSRCFPGYRSVI